VLSVEQLRLSKNCVQGLGNWKTWWLTGEKVGEEADVPESSECDIAELKFGKISSNFAMASQKISSSSGYSTIPDMDLDTDLNPTGVEDSVQNVSETATQSGSSRRYSHSKSSMSEIHLRNSASRTRTNSEYPGGMHSRRHTDVIKERRSGVLGSIPSTVKDAKDLAQISRNLRKEHMRQTLLDIKAEEKKSDASPTPDGRKRVVHFIEECGKCTETRQSQGNQQKGGRDSGISMGFENVSYVKTLENDSDEEQSDIL